MAAHGPYSTPRAAEFNEHLSADGRFPLLPLKDMVIFPGMVVPLLVGRPASLGAVEESLASSRGLYVCTQRDPEVEDPEKDDLYSTGVVVSILQSLRMPDGSLKVVVEGHGRGRIKRVYGAGDWTEAQVREIKVTASTGDTVEALMRTALNQFEEYARLGQRVAPEVVMSLRSVTESDALSDLICAYLSVPVKERQELLEIFNVRKRLETISTILMRENELFTIEQKVRERVREQMDKGQREFYLQEQLKIIQQELGSREDGIDESSELGAMIKKARMPKDVREKAERELTRFERMPLMSPEAAVIRTYIEWLAEVPWHKRTKDALDMVFAQRVLDEDHYGLKKVKERILEFLAVRKLSDSTKGPVLCFVGPPGVGKTSLGESISRAMGRKFVRISLGGVRDEAEIRGHRRTYIGSLPGRIIQSMKKVAVKNPVFMLDEIDKMSTDFRGDPSSALLEVLDPEQNHAFSDHFLEVDYDLHEVFFITTANSEFDIPEALLDRMELIQLSGYTPYEKERIAKLFLVPKQMKECGLGEDKIHFTDSAIDTIIRRYTREAGVRELERQIGNVCRKVARKVVSSESDIGRTRVNGKKVLSLLGPPEYTELRVDEEPQVGLSVGLAWTMSGGDILYIETTKSKGKGGLTLTGQLGEVMQESAQAAYTYLRSRAKELGIRSEFWKTMDIHVHVPEGAIPKDGPSAGVAIAVSMLSALRAKAPRKTLAMTGEITLLGRVLDVGGVKEKILAAHRAGIRTILLPTDNEKDLIDVPNDIKKDLKFHLVNNMDEVLSEAFPGLKFSTPTRKKSRKRT